MLRSIFFLLFTTLLLYGKAQHPYFYAINDDNGLPSNEVYDLLQDENGYIWVGTNAGLYRYDGTDFIPFKNSSQNSKALSHIVIDKEHKIWCQNFSGQLFSISGDSLKLEYDWSKRKANFPAFSFDEQNNIWLTADSGLYCFNKQKQISFFKSADLNGIKNNSIFADVKCIDKKIYYDEQSGFGYISEGKIIRLDKTNRPNRLKDIQLFSSFHKVENRLLLLSRSEKQNSLWEIQNDSILWRQDLPIALGRVFSIHNDGAGKLWIGSTNGALCLNYNLEQQFEGQHFFPGKSISKVLLDKEGNYYFSTLLDGIFVVPSTAIWLYTKENSLLADSRIRQLAKDDNDNVYVGYQNGTISKCNFASKQFKTTSLENSPTEIQALFVDKSMNQLFVGQNKTWLLDLNTLKTTYAKGISHVKSIAKLNGDTFLLGAVTGSYLVTVKPEVVIFHVFRNKRTRVVYNEKENHRLWMCYADGLWINTDNNDVEVRHKNAPIFGTEILQTADGLVWVSTMSQGVLAFKDGIFVKQLNENIGIKNGFVRKIATDGHLLWMATEDELISYNLQNGKQKNYNRFDGLPSLEISDMEFANGKILLATPKGLVEIPTDFNAENKISPSIFIASFAVRERDTMLSDNYQLNFSENNIRVTFKGIAFRSHGEFAYKYRMIGLDSNWITTNSKSNFARYPSLPAGKYIFEVIALNEDGIASKSPAKISIEILKPFWQKWWFYLICAITLSGIVFTYFNWRLQLLRKRNELEKRMANSQLATLKSQMNPHFMFNALNSIQDLVLQQETAHAQLYLGKFSDLTRKVLDASGAEFIPLQKEIEMLTLYLDLEKLRFGNEMQYTMSVDPTLDEDEVKLPSMIIQPFVENALNHGLLHKQGEKNLSVSFKRDKDALICIVEDNGVGREAAAAINARKKKHKSFATEATSERLRLLNEIYALSIKLEVIDKPQGTKVIISMPLKDE